jgi:hypothetical protein
VDSWRPGWPQQDLIACKRITPLPGIDTTLNGHCQRTGESNNHVPELVLFLLGDTFDQQLAALPTANITCRRPLAIFRQTLKKSCGPFDENFAILTIGFTAIFDSTRAKSVKLIATG